jgi:predicted anti-sigma-YlaC factor YlaD
MILYQANKAQHENPLIQGESCIQTISQSAHKNYDANAAAIQNQIHTREQKLGTTIIPPQQWSLITKQSKTKHRYLQRSHLIGRLLTILTVGIYKLVG